MLKFNVDGATKGILGPPGVGVVLRNRNGIVLALFSKHVGCMESNEAEVVAILEALQIFISSHSKLVVESDSLHPCRFQFLKQIKVLSSMIEVNLHHVGHLANGFADTAKQGVERSIPFVVVSL